MTCEKCGVVLAVGDFPFCPHGLGNSTVVGDECDFVQENGFAHPRRFRSKQDYARTLREKGLENAVRHVTLPGTDKSPYTSDWSRGIDPQTLANVKALMERQGHGRGKDAIPDDVAFTFTVTDAPV